MAFADLPFLAGILLGLSLAAPPGPVTALMAREAVDRGARAAAMVGLGASTADACFLLLALAGGLGVLASRPTLLGAVSLAGAALLLYYAWGAWRAGRIAAQASAKTLVSIAAPRADPVAAHATFRTGFLAAATSPFNLAWWVGPGSVLVASTGLLLIAGLFVGILLWVVLFTQAVERLGNRVARAQSYVAYASAVILAGFAVGVAWRGTQLLGWVA